MDTVDGAPIVYKNSTTHVVYWLVCVTSSSLRVNTPHYIFLLAIIASAVHVNRGGEGGGICLCHEIQ